MTATTTAQEMSVALAAKLIAAEIRTAGHYQGYKQGDDGEDVDGACLVANKTFPHLPVSIRLDLSNQIADRAKHTAAWNSEQAAIALRRALVRWNDETSTETVLEVLDGIAASAG